MTASSGLACGCDPVSDRQCVLVAINLRDSDLIDATLLVRADSGKGMPLETERGVSSTRMCIGTGMKAESIAPNAFLKRLIARSAADGSLIGYCFTSCSFTDLTLLIDEALSSNVIDGEGVGGAVCTEMLDMSSSGSEAKSPCSDSGFTFEREL